MMFTAGNALVSRSCKRWVVLSVVVVLQLAGTAVAGDGSLSETLVWAHEGQNVVATYSRDRDGAGTLRFREQQGRKSLPISWLVESDKDLVANLALASMQQFNGLFVVTLESSSGLVVQVYTYDEARSSITEVASTSGRWPPQLLYYGDQADPAVSMLKQQGSSKGRQPGLICGEKVYTYNRAARRVDEISVRWTARGREPGKLDANCVD
jgi:hypothetical protein